MFLVYLVVAISLVIMAALYADESNRILQKWGFLCGKKDRQVRHPRIEVTQVGDKMNDVKCTLQWKDIKIDDQILTLNGISVANLENTQIRAIMLLACSSNPESNDTVCTVEFTNADKQRKELEILSQKKNWKIRNKSRVRPSLNTKYTVYEESLSPKDRKAIRNKDRVRPMAAASATKKNGGG